jgi:hypothetical protein
MTNLHPHWQSTEEEQPVPVRAARAAGDAPHAKVSRLPAAIVGIAIMIGGFAYSFGGVREILGQLTAPTPDVTIRLTTDGPDPDPATVRPGNVIRFLNEDQIPHVLTSDTLPTPDGEPFETPIIFAASDYFFTLPLNAPEGTYSFISETNPEFSGEIVVSLTAAAASSASSVIVAAPVSSVPQLPPSSSSVPALPLTVSSSSAAPSPLPAGVIAVNPHVVGARSSGAATSRKPGVTQHKPTSNAESGAGTWIGIACAAVAMAFAAKGAFRRA